ncbi:dnaJ homolog subfamily C member 9-like [Teleopsis dalmanni]|uniref:dnaJ homolog subfamily C member 9-like n=1 Tax=Teleopsis dalmanni TaxID=139649 RepID=UPI0018CD7D49|nr:dnaJ homolog subfamily C member 9-like [Teleopsis dalmanni]
MSTLELCEKLFGTRDIYKLFDIPKTATDNQIKKAYYKLSLKVHPDRVANNEKETATEKFKLLSKLYQVLTDSGKRALYDERNMIDDDDVENDELVDEMSQWFVVEEGPSDELVFSMQENIEPKCTWTHNSTKELLSLVSTNIKMVGKCRQLRSKAMMWKFISTSMSAVGYLFTPNQVQSKFRAMERQYKRVKLNNSQTGRNRMVSPYQSELDEILSSNRSINPEFTLDESASCSTSFVSARTTDKEKRPSRRTGGATAILAGMREDRQQHYKNVERILQENNERLVNIEERKLGLLEEIVKNLYDMFS